jgi:hypothetical protein
MRTLARISGEMALYVLAYNLTCVMNIMEKCRYSSRSGHQANDPQAIEPAAKARDRYGPSTRPKAGVTPSAATFLHS